MFFSVRKFSIHNSLLNQLAEGKPIKELEQKKSASIYKSTSTSYQISTVKFPFGTFSSDKLSKFFEKSNYIDRILTPKHLRTTEKTNGEPLAKHRRIGEMKMMKATYQLSADAAEMIAGPDQIDQLGTPYGKELTGFNLTGTVRATFFQGFTYTSCHMLPAASRGF